jgi:hypothetical protein
MRTKVGKVLSFEGLTGRGEEPVYKTVERSEQYMSEEGRADRVRGLIEKGLLGIEPIEKPNHDLRNFDYTHQTNWDTERGDWYAIELFEEK